MLMTLTLKNFQCAVHNCTCRNEESLARFNWTTVTNLDHITKKHLTLPGRWYPFFILGQVFFCWLYEVKHFLTLKKKNGPNFVITVRQTMNINNILYQIYVISFSLHPMDIDETWYLTLINCLLQCMQHVLYVSSHIWLCCFNKNN